MESDLSGKLVEKDSILFRLPRLGYEHKEAASLSGGGFLVS